MILEVFHLTPSGIMPREALVKTASGLATAIFGGSSGPEGPSTVISGGFSNWLNKVLKLRMESGKALMIGVAAGFSASFKTPLTGLLFAIELPYRRDLEKEAFIEAAIASSTAYLVSAGLGAQSLIPVVELELIALPLYWLPISMVFGLGTGAVVIAFTGVYSACERLAKQIIVRGGYPLMLLLGGLTLGSIGYLAPQAVGPGYQMFALLGGGVSVVLAAVFVLRILSTSVTMNFGGTGGLFLPTLLLGGAWGALVGSLLMPSLTPLFVLMGMASFSAGVHKMMLTPIVFIAEVYGAPNIIPIILATVVCFFVSGAVPFYPIQPANKVGEEELALERFYYKVIRARPKELEKITAKAVATPNPVHLHANITVREAMDAFGRTSFRLLPVVDSEGRMVGYVTLESLAFLSKTALDKPLNTAELRNPLVYEEEALIMGVIGEMVEKKEDHCFIVDAEGHLTGIISGIDATRLLMRYYTHS
jgi:CIC family chloride channel protein